MDPLRDQHTAAIAGEAAAARLVIVALRPPEPDDGRAADEIAQRAGRDPFGKPHARRAEPVLQHDAERHAGVPAGGDDLLGARRRDLDRLLEQHMLARRGAALRDLQMRVRGAEHQNGRNGRIGQHRLQTVRQREGKRSANEARRSALGL